MSYNLEISGSITVRKEFKTISDLIEYMEYATINGMCSLSKDGVELDCDTQQRILEAATMAHELGVWVLHNQDDVEL